MAILVNETSQKLTKNRLTNFLILNLMVGMDWSFIIIKKLNAHKLQPCSLISCSKGDIAEVVCGNNYFAGKSGCKQFLGGQS